MRKDALSFLLVWLSTCSKTLAAAPALYATTVDPQGKYEDATATQNALGIPTLIYNCAKLPAICNNVNQRKDISELNTDPNSQDFMKLKGKDHIEMHYDPNHQRKIDRRKTACPDTGYKKQDGTQVKPWTQDHVCPEPDQPPVVPDVDRLEHQNPPVGKTKKNGFTGTFCDAASVLSVHTFHLFVFLCLALINGCFCKAVEH